MNTQASSAPLMKRKSLWGLIILLLGMAGAYFIVSSAPRPARVPPEVKARLVDVQPLQQEMSGPYWQTGGLVSAVDNVSLTAQVSGRIDWVNPDASPGSVLKKGTVLARIEQADYRLQVQQANAALVQAESELAIEKGQGDLAREEYSLAASELSRTDRELVLRVPQQEAAQAAVQSAAASLEQAQLSLARTEIRMPFDGRISSRAVSVGTYASSGSALFDVVGTGRVWIEVKVPRHFLGWLNTDAPAELSLPSWNGKTRDARILNTLPDVDDADRMARVLLELEQPLAAGQPPVLVNDYLDVRLPGRAVQAVVVASRLLNDDGSLWVVNNNQLARRQPQVIFRGREKTWLGSGLESGDQLLKNRIDSATPGMAVRTRQSDGAAQ